MGRVRARPDPESRVAGRPLEMGGSPAILAADPGLGVSHPPDDSPLDLGIFLVNDLAPAGIRGNRGLDRAGRVQLSKSLAIDLVGLGKEISPGALWQKMSPQY